MPKIKINYDNMIFYKVYCINPNIKKMFIGHTTNMVQRKHILKKQSEIRYSEMFDVINKNGGWMYWRIKEIEKYNECKTYADVLLREKHHYDTVYDMMNDDKIKINFKDEEYEEKIEHDDNYKCKYCDYECLKKKHFQQHISTRKHNNMVIEIEKINEYKKKMNEYNENIKVENVQNISAPDNMVESEKKEYTCNACGNVYKNMSGLCKHRHLCKVQHPKQQNKQEKKHETNEQKEAVSKTIHNECDIELEPTELTSTMMPDKEKDEIILQLLKDNESMKTFMKEQNNMLKEMMRQINTNGSSTITTTNNIKQKFNINIFLNEQCKDAINMCDFIKSLKITFHDLEITRDKSLEESVSTIMLRGLKELDVYKRPIHCTDQKRDIMYIKDEEKWEKDDGNVKLKESIGTLSKKQMFTLKELRDSDPEIKTNDEKKDRFITTMNHVCTPIPETSEKKMIKTIGKEMYIDKDEE
jgi:hypothetical protein